MLSRLSATSRRNNRTLFSYSCPDTRLGSCRDIFCFLPQHISHNYPSPQKIQSQIIMKESEILSNIASRLNIQQLNEMQQAMLKRAASPGDITLLSPTGSGKTLAFLIPLLKSLKEPTEKLQAVIIAPSRELATQIFEITRVLASSHKVSCCYGGHSMLDEKQSLAVVPSILISTPGRLVDHIKRGNIDLYSTRILILDEFDKSLELGFHEEMKKIVKNMPNVSRKILTSATMIDEMPDFINLNNPTVLNFLYKNAETRSRMKVWRAESSSKDKLDALRLLLLSLNDKKTIVFANYRESVDRIYTYLKENNIAAGIYHGALEQIDREKAIAMFNNESYNILITTDLGSRGLDIEGVAHIIHYHLPTSAEAYTHRNGRTARVDNDGEIFVITAPEETLPDFITTDETFAMPQTAPRNSIEAKNVTLYFMAGKKEKISRGDIVGFIANNSLISAQEIGKIDVKDHYSLVAVPTRKAKQALSVLSTCKIKNKKVKIGFAKVV